MMLKLFTIAIAIFAVTLAGEGTIALNEMGYGEAEEAVFLDTEWNQKRRDNEPVTIVAFGDLMMGRYVRQLMNSHGLDYPLEYFPELLQHMLQDGDNTLVEEPDFIFANLEGPITDKPYVNPGTAMVFNFKPDVVEPLKKYGINLVTLANNHAYDMGADGVAQTRVNLAENGIHHFGDSKGLRPETTWTTTLNETTITFFGLNDTLKDRLDFQEVSDHIAGAEEEADFTIVAIHWGTEYKHTPTTKQVEQAHAMVDAGADMIIGHHPHVIQTDEVYHGAPIYYSLGNFIFDQYFQDDVQEGLGLTITLKKSLDARHPNEIKVKETIFDIIKSQVKVRE
jgi:poly-gamma-glutamate synthesis protein (capsule biosynthesis protein)